MPHPLVQPAGQWMRDVLSDEEVVRRVLAGEEELFELIVRRHNQRLYRAVRAVARDDDDAEEALQRAWIAGWRGLSGFAGRASVGAWLTRIALRCAGELARARRRAGDLSALAAGEEVFACAPDEAAAGRELTALLERSIDALPEPYRVVFVLRAVQGLSTLEVAAALELGESAVKVRLHRARAMLQSALLACAEREGALASAFAFDGERCERVWRAVRAARAAAGA